MNYMNRIFHLNIVLQDRCFLPVSIHIESHYYLDERTVQIESRQSLCSITAVCKVEVQACDHIQNNISEDQNYNCSIAFSSFIFAYSIMSRIDKTSFVKKNLFSSRCIEFACTVGTFPYPWHVASIDSMYLKSQIWELHVLLAFVGICLFTSQILRSKVFNSFNFVLLELTCQNGIYSKTELWHFTALLGRNYQEKSDPICEYKKSEWAFYFFW